MSPSFTPSRNPAPDTGAGAEQWARWAWLPPWWSQPSGEAARQPALLPGECAQCYQCGKLLLVSPWLSLSLPWPWTAPSVRGGTGKEEERQRVSGRLGCVLGCSLLLLPPGHLGLSSWDPSAPSRHAASCNRDEQLVLHDFHFFFLCKIPNLQTFKF